MAQGTSSITAIEDNKVALDKADLPLPAVEDEPEVDVDGQEASAEPEVAFAPGSIVEEGQEGGKRPSKLVMLGAAAAVLLLLLAAAWFFFLRGPAAPPAPVATNDKPAAVASAGPPRAGLAPFVVPIMTNPRGRLLQISVVLEFNSDEVKDMVMAEHTAAIRDVIYRNLRNRSAEDLNSARMNSLLQGQMKEQINKALGGEFIKSVYFPDFLFAG